MIGVSKAMDSSLCFFHIPGKNSKPESDAQPDDLVFVVPFKYVNKAIEESIENKDIRFLYLSKSSWTISNEFDKEHLSGMFIKISNGEIEHPERFTVV